MVAQWEHMEDAPGRPRVDSNVRPLSRIWIKLANWLRRLPIPHFDYLTP
jgi:hypothetical protein